MCGIKHLQELHEIALQPLKLAILSHPRGLHVRDADFQSIQRLLLALHILSKARLA
jgi:hypothetical protein